MPPMPVRIAPVRAAVRASHLVPMLAAAALACAKPPPPAPAACGADGARARFDPAAARCDCSVPSPASWQAAAPRGPGETVREKEPVRIGLRRIGTADFVEKEIEAEVLAPNGTSATGVGAVTPPEWGLLQFPADFPLGAFHRAGTYTVLWRVDGAVVACDGFVIEPRLAPPPPPVEAAGGADETGDDVGSGEEPDAAD